MSLSLVRQVDWAPRRGNEDIRVSRAVESAMQGLGSCAVFRRLDGWVHYS
eukprot:CAMPEP_0171250616 /NCGR_PEP_ID=MMETSP0790-20130122/50198_1 /TAXON_ID=2925 /ORGANISM="Alexandrium catenella, Strain OF101" /LENGTH=49 /DNA_ID= /DNA_START= /DNA_END= /DNA_ORIENTATION=